MKKYNDLSDWNYKVIGVSFKDEKRIEKLYKDDCEEEYIKFIERINKKIINFLNTMLLEKNNIDMNKKEKE